MTCVNAADLSALQAGDLPETRLEEVAAHLEACPRCAAAAREMDTRVDPFLGALRLANAERPAPVADPRRIGPYEILGELGRGGMGAVYRARHVWLGRTVALKLLPGGSFADPDRTARFRAEAQVVANLRHPHIVALYEAGIHDDGTTPTPFYTMELIEGGTLATLLAGKPVAANRAAELVEPLARAAHAAHGAGVVHRDIKPANVLIAGDGLPKLCDFGIAKQLVADGPRTRSDVLVGTPEYMAPEQAGGAGAIGPATDVYALGAVLYAALVGRPPFQAATPLETLALVQQREPLPPGRLQPSVPRDLETICLKCLEKEPARRYATAEALADDLQRFRGGQPILARPASLARRTWSAARRRPTRTALVAVSLAAGVAALLGGVYHARRLQREVAATKAAERRAEANATEAARQRDLAMRSLRRLVFEVQDQVRARAELRPVRQRLLDEALRGLNELAEETATSAPNLTRAAAHSEIGYVYNELGRYEEAAAQFDRARTIAAAVWAADPTDREARVTWCLATCRRAAMRVGSRGPNPSDEYFLPLLEAARAWAAAEPDDEQAKYFVLSAYDYLGGFARTPDEARRWFTALRDEGAAWFARYPTHPDAVRLKVAATVWHAMNPLPDADPVARRAALAEALALQQGVVKQRPTDLHARRILAGVHDHLRAAAQANGEPDEARRHAAAAVEQFRAMSDRDPDNPSHRRDLVVSYHVAAAIEAQAGRPEAGMEWMRQARDFLAALEAAGKLPDPSDERTQLAKLRKLLATMEALPKKK